MLNIVTRKLNLYDIGLKYNMAIKYNLLYDRRATLDYVCGTCIDSLLDEKYPLNTEQRSKLTQLLNNLIML